MTQHPTQESLLRTDHDAIGRIIQERQDILSSLGDTTDLPLQSFRMVLADLVFQAWYHSAAISLLLEHELEPSLLTVQRALYEAAVAIGYLFLHPDRNREAVIFLAYTHLRDIRDNPTDTALFADRQTILDRMPSSEVTSARSRLQKHPYTWSGRSIKEMATLGKVSGYSDLYQMLCGAAHAGLTGRYVKVFDLPDGMRRVATGSEMSSRSREAQANFTRRLLHGSFRLLMIALPCAPVEIATFDPETWQPAPE